MPALHDIVTKGATDRSVVVHIMDSADGTPETGVVFNTSGIDLWYRREGAARVAVTEATLAALTTAHTDGGFLHVSDGDYRLDLPDAAFATGANYVDFGGTVTGMVVVGGRVRLIDASLEVANLAANVTQISGDSTAADNLETAFDDAAGAVSWMGIIDQGTAQSATATTVVLRSAAAFGDNTLVGTTIGVLGSTQGYWQFGLISANVGSTDTVTVPTWPVTPSGTLTYKIFGTAAGNGSAGLDAAGVRAAVGLASANLDTQLADLPTVAELDAELSPLATSAQLNNIAVAGSPVLKTASSFTLTTGSVSSGTVASTLQSNNIRHIIADAAGTLECYYEFSIGGDGISASVQIEGYVSGSNDTINVFARNWAGSSWDQVGAMVGQTSTTDNAYQYNLTVAHTGTGASLGLVRIRFQNTGLSTATLNVDRLLVGHAIVNRTVGYQSAAVWMDTIGGTAGTETYVNGTVDRPVGTLADAVTIADAIGLRRFHLGNGSSITLASSFTRRDFIGENWDLALGGQALTDCVIGSAYVSGTMTGAGNIFYDCDFTTVTLPPCLLHECGISALTVGSAGEFDAVHCHADSDPAIIDFGAAVGATEFHMRGFAGDIEIRNLLTGDIFELDGDGALTLAASCTGGTVRIAGNIALTNSGSGMTIVDTARFAEDQMLNANLEQINTVPVTGDGSGTPFGV